MPVAQVLSGVGLLPKMCTIQNANDRTLTMTPAVRQVDPAPGLQLAAPCVAGASKCEVPCAKCSSRLRRNAVRLHKACDGKAQDVAQNVLNMLIPLRTFI